MSENAVVSDSWSSVLEKIERDLAAVEAALDDDAPNADRSIPTPSPRSLPSEPMPVELAPRAEYLLVRTRSLEARALADKDRIATSLRALAGRHQAPESGRTGRVVDIAG
jgi:hypothetical protein